MGRERDETYWQWADRVDPPTDACDECGGPGGLLAPHTGRLLCDLCVMAMLTIPAVVALPEETPHATH